MAVCQEPAWTTLSSGEHVDACCTKLYLCLRLRCQRPRFMSCMHCKAVRPERVVGIALANCGEHKRMLKARQRRRCVMRVRMYA